MPLPPSHYHAMTYAENGNGGRHVRSMNSLHANIRMRQARFLLQAIRHWNGVNVPASRAIVNQLLAMSVAAAIRHIIMMG